MNATPHRPAHRPPQPHPMPTRKYGLSPDERAHKLLGLCRLITEVATVAIMLAVLTLGFALMALPA